MKFTIAVMVRRSSSTTRRKKTVVLIRQFRVATWVNGNESGQLIETCAGLLDNDEPEVCIRKEAIEETGYEVGEVRKLFELYMSPGGVTELIHFFYRRIQ
ncbi:NUDIX domain-containing protein [Escherichia sp. E2593]|uniref:NUDIX domain-containing protein n=1 Tax=Escherichia sp. E2593 TaxID=2044458 RepID=UPI001FEF90A0|nr:NUDIX domain-containing protein [Escherichia sp. E2593]